MKKDLKYNNIDLIKIENKKSISITIDTAGNAILKLPHRHNDKLVNEFVNLKQEWIISQKTKIKARNDLYSDIINMRAISIKGEIMPITISNLVKKTNVKKMEFSNAKDLIKYLKNICKKILLEKVNYWSSKINIDYSNFKLDGSHRRWGVCTSTKEIKLNFRVAMLEEYIIDYIVIHELCHLIHFNHSNNFWNLVEQYCKNYKKCKENLKTFDFLLQMYK